MKLYLSFVLCLLFFVSCSKPSAEEYFAIAQKAQQEVQESLDSPMNVQDSLQAVALENYSKLVADHPESELVESSLFNIATIHNNTTHDHQKAVAAYKRYFDLYPDGTQAPLSLFMIGYIYGNELYNLDSAAVAYRRFLDMYPQHEMALSAQFELNNLGKTPDELLPQAAGTEVATKPATAKNPIKQKNQ